MANRNIIRIARGSKTRINTLLGSAGLEQYEIVYATDTMELGIVNANDTITWYKSIDLTGYATESYVDNKISEEIGDIDFSDFAKSVNNKLPDGNGNISITIADLDGVPKTRKIAGVELSSDISQATLTNALRVATDSLSGIMSADDHVKLTSLYAIFDSGSENYVDTLREILEIFEDYPESTNLITLIGTKVDKTTTVNSKALSGNITLNLDDVADGSVRKLSDKLDKNALITGATKTKITYDAKGLVVSGADLVATDIPNLPASKITSGTLPVARGGLGVGTLTSGEVLVGNGTGAVNTVSRNGIDTRTSFPPSSHNHDAVYLKLVGGTMAGDIDMDGNALLNVELDGGDL